MARGRSVIVGGGLASVGALVVGAFTYVSVVDPASVSISPMMAQVTGANKAVVISADRTDPVSTATEVLRVRGGAIMEGDAGDSIVIGRGAAAPGTSGSPRPHVIIGTGAAIGAIATGSVVIGNLAVITGGSGVCIGASSQINGGGSATQIAIGGTIGTGAAGGCVCIGGSMVDGVPGTAGAVALGVASICRATRTVAIGYLADAGFTTSVALGTTAKTSSSGQLAIGFGAQAQNAASIAIGGNSATTTTKQCVIGGPNSSYDISQLLVGGGDTASAPLGLFFRLTNGTGTDIAGGNFNLQAGLGTSAGVPGAVQFSIGVQTGTGAVLQTARVGAEVRFSSTATHTYLLIWDVDNAALERVTVGAADSAGAGFKVLRIPN